MIFVIWSKMLNIFGFGFSISLTHFAPRTQVPYLICSFTVCLDVKFASQNELRKLQLNDVFNMRRMRWGTPKSEQYVQCTPKSNRKRGHMEFCLLPFVFGKHTVVRWQSIQSTEAIFMHVCVCVCVCGVLAPYHCHCCRIKWKWTCVRVCAHLKIHCDLNDAGCISLNFPISIDRTIENCTPCCLLHQRIQEISLEIWHFLWIWPWLLVGTSSLHFAYVESSLLPILFQFFMLTNFSRKKKSFEAAVVVIRWPPPLCSV